MSRTLLFVAIFLLPAFGDDGYRDFEDVEGRIIAGKVVAFDDAQQIVSFQRKSDGAILKVKLTVFSQPDRQYVRGWSFQKTLAKDLVFTSTPRSIPRSEGVQDGGMYRVVEARGYEVLIANNSGHDIERINLDYCIFYRQGLRKVEGMIFDEGVFHGNASVELDPTSKQGTFKTQTIDLYSQHAAGNLFGNLNDAKGEVHGIWIKARVATPSGEQFICEYRSSRGADWKWTDQSIGAGLNK